MNDRHCAIDHRRNIALDTDGPTRKGAPHILRYTSNNADTRDGNKRHYSGNADCSISIHKQRHSSPNRTRPVIETRTEPSTTCTPLFIPNNPSFSSSAPRRYLFKFAPITRRDLKNNQHPPPRLTNAHAARSSVWILIQI